MNPETANRRLVWALARTIGRPEEMARVRQLTDAELLAREELARTPDPLECRLTQLETIVRLLVEKISNAAETES